MSRKHHNIILDKKLFFGLIFILVIISCRSWNPSISRQNMAGIYQTSDLAFLPSTSIFHPNDSQSILYIKILNQDLLFVRKNFNDSFLASVKVHCDYYKDLESNTLLDSSTHVFSLAKDPAQTFSYLTITIKPIVVKGCIRIEITDCNRNISRQLIQHFDRSSPLHRQRFLITNESGTPFLNPWLNRNDTFTIEYFCKRCNLLQVRAYFREYPIATPPFTVNKELTFNYKPDSIFYLHLNEGKSAGLCFPKPGYYHIVSDTLSKIGLTIYRFEEGFPEITTPLQMLLSLRYLTTKNEFEKMILQKNKKAAVDEFWLKIAGNAERARELIKKYYNRVEDANRYFTSYQQGWKTDRGIIYIIYGPPNLVYINNTSENWTYGEQGNIMSVNFTFTKAENPYSDNDYILNRSSIYKDSWNTAIDFWRR